MYRVLTCRHRNGRRHRVARVQVWGHSAPRCRTCHDQEASRGRVFLHRSGRRPSFLPAGHSPLQVARSFLPVEADALKLRLVEADVLRGLAARCLRCHLQLVQVARCPHCLAPAAVVVRARRDDQAAVAGKKAVGVPNAGIADHWLEKSADFSGWADSAACNRPMNRLRIRCVPAPCLS